LTVDDTNSALWEANAETWTQLARAGYDVHRDFVNTPAFLAALPPVAGLHGLDVGCGEGANTRAVARQGARLDAIDVAPTFVAHAAASERAEPLGITYRVADAQALPFDDAAFDFAVAFMSLMDVPDYRAALAEAHRVVRPGGFLQFSILHPCFVPPHRRVVRDAAGRAHTIEIARYFDRVDGDVERWKFSAAPDDVKAAVEPFAVPIFHHTLADWVNTLVQTGFALEYAGEPSADAAAIRAHPELADTLIAPLFLHIRARR
jgi:ubiquinone/menaquinone biosynthesis C-methylase UbiE